MRLLKITLFALLCAGQSIAAPFISEYVEGSGLNKAIEIYNPDSSSINLSTCTLSRYANGSSTPDVGLTLSSSTLNEGETFVIVNSGAEPDLLALADLTDGGSNLSFNGDDALELKCGGVSVDIIGRIGEDPGSAWGTAPTTTANASLRRKSNVCTGDTNGSDAFDPAVEWDGFPTNTFDGLGGHTANCSIASGPQVTSITRLTPLDQATNAASVVFEVTFTESVTGVSLSNFSLDADQDQVNATLSAVNGSGTSWQVSVTTSAGDGSLSIDLDQNLAGIINALSEPLALIYTQGEAYTIDHTAPTILGVVPNTVGPTSAPQITFSVQFSEAVSGLDNASDVQINTTGTVNTSSLNFSANTSATQQIIVGGITGTGTLSLSVLSNSVTDQVGFQNNAGATSVDVAIDPNVVISGPVGLLFSEIVVQPTGAEFIEIHNPGSTTIDLSDVYVTDATFSPNSVYYYNLVNGTNAGGGGFEDFNARFPDGSSIAAGDYQTIALQGSTSFQAAYGILPDYELYEDDGAADGVADMREATAGSINGQGQLSDGVNDGEVAVLYYWDGSSDLVADLDYLVWGDKNEAVSKTGISIDGPDAGATATPYLNDTDIIAQAVIRSSSHADGISWQRVDNTEGNEIQFGGNGLSGHNETSEDLYLTWGVGTPTPGSATDSGTSPFGPNILINEVDANASAEFVEFFDGGTGPISLNGLSLVFFDGATDQVSISYDLDGLSTNNEGYFVAGNASTSPDLTIPDQSMLDGPAAVAIFIGNATDFPAGTAISTFGLIDAVVYGNTPTDSGLLPLLNNGQDQVSEGNDATTNSLQRCPNGGGGVRNTANFAAVTPTIGLANMNCPVGEYYANVDASTPQTLRTTLHDTIKDHQRFPYTSSATDTWDILELADESPSDSNAIWAVYKNVDYPKAGGGNNNYNREHTWPKSLGFPGTDDPNNYPVTDAHHLMLSDTNYNSHRGNKYYDDCTGTCTEDETTANHGVGGPGMSNWYDGVSYETWDFRKGDVARAMFYMDVRYEGGTHSITGSSEPDLILTDNASLIQGRSDGIGYMGLLTTLLEWSEQDPVDAIEQQRNEVVFSFQGNRNPFVDHPEWIACIFQNNCTATPSEVIFSNGFE